MTAVVFAGPSIYGLAKHTLAGIELRPPAACGDILRACRSDVSRIGLVDGVFETSPSVWHKEILFALSRGIRLFGAASMGALRAAECHHFGMEGLGRIFEQYKSGERIGRRRCRGLARTGRACLPAADGSARRCGGDHRAAFDIGPAGGRRGRSPAQCRATTAFQGTDMAGHVRSRTIYRLKA